MNVSPRKIALTLASVMSAGAGLIGLSSTAAPQVNLQATPQQFRQAAKDAQPVRQSFPVRVTRSPLAASQDLDGFFPLPHNGGTPPKIWGMSEACRRMVRQNRLRRAGLGGQRI